MSCCMALLQKEKPGKYTVHVHLLKAVFVGDDTMHAPTSLSLRRISACAVCSKAARLCTSTARCLAQTRFSARRASSSARAVSSSPWHASTSGWNQKGRGFNRRGEVGCGFVSGGASVAGTRRTGKVNGATLHAKRRLQRAVNRFKWWEGEIQQRGGATTDLDGSGGRLLHREQRR